MHEDVWELLGPGPRIASLGSRELSSRPCWHSSLCGQGLPRLASSGTLCNQDWASVDWEHWSLILRGTGFTWFDKLVPFTWPRSNIHVCRCQRRFKKHYSEYILKYIKFRSCLTSTKGRSFSRIKEKKCLYLFQYSPQFGEGRGESLGLHAHDPWRTHLVPIMRAQHRLREIGMTYWKTRTLTCSFLSNTLNFFFKWG